MRHQHGAQHTASLVPLLARKCALSLKPQSYINNIQSLYFLPEGKRIMSPFYRLIFPKEIISAYCGVFQSMQVP
jgi:hypothetical protein